MRAQRNAASDSIGEAKKSGKTFRRNPENSSAW